MGVRSLDGSTARATDAATIREAVGVFRDPDALNAAISDLLGAGVDRAALSLMAQVGVLDGKPAKGYRQMASAEDDPSAPRQAVYADTDVRQGRTLATSMASAIAAFAASGVVVLTGGAALTALAAAIGAGGGVGVFGAWVGKRIGAEQRKHLERQMARGGILLWIKIMDPAQERRICELLAAHAAVDVHLHDIPASGAPLRP